jgi:hypothetical protein
MAFRYMASIPFSYGFYRGWTLPIWSDHSETPIRVILSAATGVKYILPPFCFVKYSHLGQRLWNRYYNINPKKEWDTQREAYQEWDLVTMRVL